MHARLYMDTIHATGAIMDIEDTELSIASVVGFFTATPRAAEVAVCTTTQSRCFARGDI